MVSGVTNITVPTLSYTMPHNGRMSLPVNSSFLVYSQLKHVSGIPAPEGTQGISISRLNLLDVLIARINNIQTNGATKLPGERLNAQQLDAEQIDALIVNYRHQIQQAAAASETMPYIPSPNAEGGSLFSLTI